MGKRKEKTKPPPKKRMDKLDTVFSCPFCNHGSSVECHIDMKTLIGEASWGVCQESFSTNITALSEAIDIYSEWIDECERQNGSQVCETLALINDDEMEMLEIKSDLLMSLMEELPSDDERLHSLMRSIEAEISGSNMEGHRSQMKSNFEEEIESWNIEEVEGHDDYFGVEWVDMDLIPISPCEEEMVVDILRVVDGFDMGENAYDSF